MSSGARIVVFTVLLMLLGAALIRGCGDNTSSDPTASVMNGAPRGLLAAKLLLDEEHVPVVIRARFEDPAPAAGTAVHLVPPPERSAWTKEDVDDLLGRVKQGDRAIVLCDDDDDPRNGRMKPLLDGIGVGCARADVPIGDETLTRATGSMPGFARLLYVRGAGRVNALEKVAAFPAWSSGQDGVVVKRAIGAGVITVVGSATVLANDGIGKADNAAFLLDETRGRTVVADERHHGSRSKAALFDAASKGMGPLTALLALALLVPLSLLSMAPRPGDAPSDDDARTGAPAAAAQARALAALLARARR